MPGVDTATHINEEKLALEAEVCMNLFALEQRCKGCVKAMRRG
jgi:hypothetical protein